MIRGKVWKFGDHVDTDVIIPARYLNTSDPAELAKHCMEDADPHFAPKVRPGDIIVAGENFGCGSSREHAPIAIKAAGAACVVAKSFARIFYRNSFNTGLPIVECPQGVDMIQEGNEIEVDLEQGLVRNLTRREEYPFTPIPPFMQDLLLKGGLLEYVKERMK
jgi:3-isopropylmalate/(R)-2-methylmalate dehydratase small subunit